jgi:hypothetical protein
MTTARGLGQRTDDDFARWLAVGGDDVREIIVEVQLPGRSVRMGRQPSRRPKQVALDAAVGDRAAILQRLARELNEGLATPPVVLRAAGAIVMRTTGQKAQAMLAHPLVKAIHPNRRFGGVAQPPTDEQGRTKV